MANPSTQQAGKPASGGKGGKAAEAKNENGKAGEASTAAASGQGRAIVLPNGERRVDFIRRRYEEGVKRGDIARELTEMTGKKVPYQIVFAATKPKEDEGDAE